MSLLKIRTIYFKATDLKMLRNWWSKALEIEPKPNKDDDHWVEFGLANINFSLLKLPEEEIVKGDSVVPVFEVSNGKFHDCMNNLRNLGAEIIDDGQGDKGEMYAICRDPFGNEFEVTTFHD